VLPALTPRCKRLALLAIVALAAFLRLYRIGTLPPGDGYDPAWYGVDALEILDGHLPVYLPTNIGREALFSYLVALSVALFGIGPHAIHIASAVVGVLTVPATFLAVESLFARDGTPAHHEGSPCQEGAMREEGSPRQGRSLRDERLLRDYGGLAAAATLACSFWHQVWSRYGVRAILVPLAVTLTTWAVSRAVRTWRRGAFAVAGALLGLGLYTYQSARVLPVLVVITFALLATDRRDGLRAALRDRAWIRQALGRLAILAVAATAVFAPMGVYLATHPGTGNERIDQVWAVSPELSLRENLRRLRDEAVDLVRVVAIEGDDEPLFGLPGRPALNPFFLTLLILGSAIAVLRIREPVAAIPLVWVPLLSVTAVLTFGGQPTKRALGALPALSMLVATGALVPLARLHGLARDRAPRAPADPARAGRVLAVVWALALVVGFGYSAYTTYRDYFILWGADPDLFTHFEAGRDAIGQYAATLPPGERIYSSPEMPDHPAIVFNSGARPGLKGYNGRVCLVYPEQTQQPTTYIVVQHEDRASLDLLARAYPTGERVSAGPDFYGEPYFTAYRIPAGARAQLVPDRPVAATFGGPPAGTGLIRLLGYDLSAGALRPGETLHVTLSYGALAPIDRAWIVFVHLLGPENAATGGPLWAQDDSEPCHTFYPTWAWAPGEIVRDTFTLAVPADAPPGAYTVQMGFYTWPEMARLTVEGTGEIAFALGEVMVGNRD